MNTGKGGDINIFTKDLVLQDGARIGATTYSNALGGNINVHASDSIQLLENRFANTFRQGDIITFISAGTVSSGNAGSVDISANYLKITDGGTIASSTLGPGSGNNITVNANSIEIIGIKPERSAPSTIAASAFNSGNAGSLLINTSQLQLKDGGVVNSASISSGDAGSIIINAKNFIEISGKAGNSQPSFISSSVNSPNEIVKQIFRVSALPTGSGGSLTINTQALNINGGGTINVGNEGSGNGGKININANTINVKNGSIFATTAIGEGGNISLNSQNIQLNDSSISATAGSNRSNGNGGNIDISADTVVLSESSNITANAFEGRGGNIEINSPAFLLSANSQVSATSEQGINGTVKINTSQLDVVNSGIATSTFTPSVLENTCSPEPPSYSLDIAGKGGTPLGPNDLFTSIRGWTEQPIPIAPSQFIQPNEAQNNETENVIVAQGWKDNGDGTVSFTITPDPQEDPTAYSSPIKSSCLHPKSVE
ncbi:MAG: hypothetical protein KAF91_13030 [Nostoc sp. TH1S01]|nr:hypothetical protein [Nostoc sp. TH1S01]